METPIEHEDVTEDEAAPEETKQTFWEQLSFFFGALLHGF
jgi:hypothetical protein